ncbi:MAG TPA: MFS transporter [Acidobacteriota bacterium]|jgi:MFS family permease|nr:MFS transporter [Acidobacteriota bacterium]HRV08932.1 MFS transporter [Acidobacteriota bacterium]
MYENRRIGSPVTERPEPPPVLRWTVLLFVSVAMFGNYYVYDSISPLADLLKAQLGFSDAAIGTLNGIYSLPNIFMVLVGGIIIDRIGTRRAVLLFTCLCVAGAGLTAARGAFWWMATGRLLFGLGAESMIVAVTTAIAKWFKGKELSFAFGLNLTIARLGSFAALNSPSWARAWYSDWSGPLRLAFLLSFTCIVGAVVYALLEAQAARRYRLGEESTGDRISWREAFTFSRSYWYIVALCATFYSAIFPFQTFAVKFFMEAHGVSREFGGFLSSLLTLFAMICTPLFGLLADRVGRRSLFMMVGSALLIPVYLIMAYTRIPLVVPMSMMGIAFSLVPAVMWPSVAYVVQQDRLGTAYGLMTMIQNVGLTVLNFLIGWSNDFAGAGADNPGGYALGMWLFSLLGWLGFLFAVLLRKAEAGPQGHGLDTTRMGTS